MKMLLIAAALAAPFMLRAYTVDTHRLLYGGAYWSWEDCQADRAAWDERHSGASYAICVETQP